jgi:hypothetical protein
MNSNTPKSDSATGSPVTPATVGSVVLLGSFFLPWINFFGKGAAGYQLREIWSVGPYLWSIPIISAVVIVLGVCKQRNVGLGRILGLLPFVFLGIALYQFGGKLWGELNPGAWLILLSGGFLLLGLSSFTGASVESVKENPTSSSHENR